MESHDLMLCSLAEFRSTVRHMSTEEKRDILTLIKQTMMEQQQEFDELREELKDSTSPGERAEITQSMVATQDNLTELMTKALECVDKGDSRDSSEPSDGAWGNEHGQPDEPNGINSNPPVKSPSSKLPPWKYDSSLTAQSAPSRSKTSPASASDSTVKIDSKEHQPQAAVLKNTKENQLQAPALENGANDHGNANGSVKANMNGESTNNAKLPQATSVSVKGESAISTPNLAKLSSVQSTTTPATANTTKQTNSAPQSASAATTTSTTKQTNSSPQSASAATTTSTIKQTNSASQSASTTTKAQSMNASESHSKGSTSDEPLERCLKVSLARSLFENKDSPPALPTKLPSSSAGTPPSLHTSSPPALPNSPPPPPLPTNPPPPALPTNPPPPVPPTSLPPMSAATAKGSAPSNNSKEPPKLYIDDNLNVIMATADLPQKTAAAINKGSEGKTSKPTGQQNFIMKKPQFGGNFAKSVSVKLGTVPRVGKSWGSTNVTSDASVSARPAETIGNSKLVHQSISVSQDDEQPRKVDTPQQSQGQTKDNIQVFSKKQESTHKTQQDTHKTFQNGSSSAKVSPPPEPTKTTFSLQLKPKVVTYEKTSSSEWSAEKVSEKSHSSEPTRASEPSHAISNADPTVSKVKVASTDDGSFHSVLQDIQRLRSPSPVAGHSEMFKSGHLKKMEESKKTTHEPTNYQSLPDDRLPPSQIQPFSQDTEGFLAEEKVKDRVTLKGWDPTILLEEMYKVQLQEDTCPQGHEYINMEGYMEKLPMNKKKATLLKTWKKRYFKAVNSCLYYYEAEDLNKSALSLPLSGGSIEDLGTNLIGIDDGRGRYLTVRCLSTEDLQRWLTALRTHTANNVTSNWIKPVQNPGVHPSKSVVLVDLGTCSVRAGILGSQPSVPKLFFPTAVAVDRVSGKEYVGIEAFRPDVRSSCKVSLPVKPTQKVQTFHLDIDMFSALMKKVFDDLKVNPNSYWVLLSAPSSLSEHTKEAIVQLLVEFYHVPGVCVADQSLLALYAYNTQSGIVVDIGERLDIVPVTDGYVVKQGLIHQPYGGAMICDVLNHLFTEKRYRFFTDVEQLIVRLALERSCFVAEDYANALQECNNNPDKYRDTIDLSKYNLPEGTWTQVSHEVGRFKAVEGLFNQSVWGIDNPSLPKLIQTAVQASPMDTRREMWRNIYLNGGVSMLPGLAQRLQAELQKLAPPSIAVEVHASPQRYHAAYIGACTLADTPLFENWCVTAAEWRSQGLLALRKWQT